MVFGTETDNAVYLWWNKRYDFTDGCYYRVILDDTAVVYTKEILFDFCNMDMSRKHTFAVDMLDKDGRVVGLTEYYETKLVFSKRTALDVTKPPYNIKPDGETDCTQAIQQALLDCDDKHFVYFPLGTYFCKEITFGGDIKIVYDSGAVIIDKKRGISEC